MPKILVIHGAGMNMRGKVQLDVFGPMTLPEYDERALVAALSQVKFPTTEVHISNPIRRGPASQTAAASQSVVAGFGIAGYALALRGIRDQLAAKK